MNAGDLLHRARIRARMTQQQLADAAGASRSAISDIERGARDPSWTTLHRLLNAAGTTVTLIDLPPAADTPRNAVSIDEESGP